MKNSVCEECKQNPWKYKCPGCSVRSCGLTCVKAHKKRTGCTGKRKLTDFVPLSKFDDNLLLSDYRMLEETKRVAESALRMRTKLFKPMVNRNRFHQLSPELRSLCGAASSRKTKLLFLPSGMLKREKNQTKYDSGSKCISWTIEWRFHSPDVVLIDHGVREDTNLCSVIENHLKPGPWINKLKPFFDVDLNSLKLFIQVRKHPKCPKALFKELDIKAPLRYQLAKVVVLEYPVIHVYLPSQSYDFEVFRDDNHKNTTPNPNGSLYDGHGIANGIAFPEDELEEDNSFEPKVIDLFKQMNNNPCQRVSEGSKVEGGVTDNPHHQAGPTEQWDAGDMELEFEQELVDSFSDLVAEMNPDDFDFECDSDDNFDLQNLGTTDFNIDGLEEGEIVE